MPRHGDAQRVSPRHFSPTVVTTAAAFFFSRVSSRVVHSASVLHRRFLPRPSPPFPTFLPCRFEARRSWSLPLGKSRRASFNEKLISRVKVVDCFGEQDPSLPLASITRRLGLCRLFIQPLFPFSPFIYSIRFFLCERRAIRASSFFSAFPSCLFLIRLSLVSPRRFLPAFSRFYYRRLLRTAAPLYYSRRRSRSMLN